MSQEFDKYRDDWDYREKQELPLNICPNCDSQFVQPQMWQKSDGPDEWRIWLRCPECEWTEDDVFGSNEIDEFDRVLDEGVAILENSLKSLTHSNMEEVVGAFTVALENDAILPEDFN